MKNSCLVALLTVAVLTGTTLFAMTPPGIVPQESLMEGDLGALSVGGNYEDGNRMIADSSSGDTTLIHIKSYFAYLGYDVVDWWTVYGTVGKASAEVDDSPITGDAKTKWSLGTCLYIFHTDVEEPEDFEGRLGVKLAVEYARYQTGTQGTDAKWSDISIVLPISYELYGEDSWPFCSLVVYAGPAYSAISGSVSGRDSSDFTQDRAIGMIGGVDLTFYKEKVSIGAYVQNFGETALGYGVRYHF